MSWQLVLPAQAFKIFVFSQCSGTDKDDELTKICCKISVTQAIKPLSQSACVHSSESRKIQFRRRLGICSSLSGPLYLACLEGFYVVL